MPFFSVVFSHGPKMGKYKHDWYSHQEAPPCSRLPSVHELSWSLRDVLLGVVGWVWPPLPHSLCTYPKWDWRVTHLAQIQKGSTLQRIFVSDGGKPKENMLQIPIGQSHALLISPGIADWKSGLRQGIHRKLAFFYLSLDFSSFSSSKLEKTWS